jgi:hypothetical protein
MEVAGGAAEAVVPEQDLDGAEVRAGIQQVGRKSAGCSLWPTAERFSPTKDLGRDYLAGAKGYEKGSGVDRLSHGAVLLGRVGRRVGS